MSNEEDYEFEKMEFVEVEVVTSDIISEEGEIVLGFPSETEQNLNETIVETIPDRKRRAVEKSERKRPFQKSWYEDDILSPWIKPSKDSAFSAWCSWCNCHLKGSKTNMIEHARRKSHLNNTPENREEPGISAVEVSVVEGTYYEVQPTHILQSGSFHPLLRTWQSSNTGFTSSSFMYPLFIL